MNTAFQAFAAAGISAVTTIAAAAIAVLPTSADAELFKLHEHKRWTVSYSDGNSNGIPMCVAGISYSDGSFWIKIDSDRDIWFDLFNDRLNYRRHEGEVALWVDRRDYFVVNAIAVNDNVQMYPYDHGRSAVDLINDIDAGRKLYFDLDGDKYSDFSVSLSGSRAALNALIDCADKL